MSPSSIKHLFPFLFAAFSSALAQSFYVAAPNTVRLGEQETVAVAHDGAAPQRVTLFLQDHPRKKNTFSSLHFDVPPERSEIVRIQVRPQDVPDAIFTDPSVKNYVVLVVQSGAFNKEVVIPITSKSGYVFVQTDKPIYTPKESVNVRIIPLTEKTLPSEHDFKLQIRNPQNVIVEERTFNRGPALENKAFVTHAFSFPPDPSLGEWTISAQYGSQFQHNSSVKFEVREYVLPTFALKLETQEVILPGDEVITGKVTATYVYGKKVEGYASFKFGVKDETGQVLYFGASPNSIELDEEGVADYVVSTNDLKNRKDIGWFPQISGNSFVVEATVVDFASGKSEVALDTNGRFSESPFIISFKRCLKDFKPGLVSLIEADITFVNGRPAIGVPVSITAAADGNVQLHVNNPNSVTDEEGRVTFIIHPEVQHTVVTVTMRTNEEKYGENQAVSTYTQHKFMSNNNGYIAISRRSGKILKPLSVFAEDVYMEPANAISDVYFMVVSRGTILLMNKLPKGNVRIRQVEFQITYDMVPSFRLVVFAHHGNELIADSLKVDVSRTCAPNAKVDIEPNFPSTEPGTEGKITIKGFRNTLVGLLAVDEAVYALRNKDLLTKSKMFNELEAHDLGCGPGGGRSTDIVLGNAGIVMMTSAYGLPPGQVVVPACEEKARRRRQIILEMAQNYTGREKECCLLGMMRDRRGLDCYNRTAIIERFNSSSNCANVFLECCLKNEERVQEIKNSLSGDTDRQRIGGNNVDVLDFVDPKDEEDFERQIAVRRDFKETWIFQDKIIGPDHKEEMAVSLPHSITTWVIQAVSVSSQYGMCVADPKKVIAFQNVFLQLNLPYSVVRNEQVEIQATVFNYGAQRIPAVVYMYGVKGICSGAQEGEKSERKKIIVEPQSAGSVSFPIIPLRTGEFDITVVALSPHGSDVIIKKLNVVPEGYPKEKSIVVRLDPTNQQARKKRDIKTPTYTDSIDPRRKQQLTAVTLSVPEDFIPGTDSCVVTVVADEIGPIVETSLQEPDKMLLLPVGCGEQTMMFMGPTMYTMRYLKVTGRMTKENEEKGYDFIRKGYQRELTFRKENGAYAAFVHRAPSVWLTAFVMKIFCQANSLVHIDEEVMCSGVRWLTQQQQQDGSFIDHNPVVHWDMMGGVKGLPSMTAFVLIALQECTCNIQQLELARARAVSYLEGHLGDLKEPLPIAIAAYALALADSVLADVAFGKLQSLEMYDEDLNTLHWESGKGSQDIEITGYGLLTYLQRNNMPKSNSIVNWLNTKRLASGSYPSTQDTVIALQALSEYAIKARAPGVDLSCNITSSNDRHLQKRLAFNEDNALILQHVKVDKVGGVLFINTGGHGVGLLSVKLKYNVPTPAEKLCKFDIRISLSEVKDKAPRRPNIPGGGNDVFVLLEDDLIRAAVGDEAGGNRNDDVVLDLDPRGRRPVRSVNHHASRTEKFKELLKRVRREGNPENSKLVLKVNICVRYLGHKNTDMGIIDAGIISGFDAVKEDLDELVKNKNHRIDKYEKTSRSVIFYLDQIPTQDYCFAFSMVRKYIVGNTQMSVVKVYDYYSPEEACTKFYSPDHNSPMLRKLCSDGICQCAEGGCPLKEPFAKISDIQDLDAPIITKRNKARDELLAMACNQNDYVWRGKPVEITRSGGFFHIVFEIEVVPKEGIEKRDILTGQTRTLLARDSCESAELVLHQEYLIMGKDGEQYLNDDGILRYRYLLDKSTSIHKWTAINVAENKFLQSALNFMARNLRDVGCLD